MNDAQELSMTLQEEKDLPIFREMLEHCNLNPRIEGLTVYWTPEESSKFIEGMKTFRMKLNA